MIRLGFRPENLTGNELLPGRLAITRLRLPSGVKLVSGDAREIAVEPGSFDIVYQSMAFTSILDDAFQQDLAAGMWTLVKPGGGILWYDFLYKHPNNPDVRAMPLQRVRKLFPEGSLTSWRVTLAPPISRRVTQIHPSLYAAFNTVPLLRTHVLCWIRKP
jgi:ubiquinone/menaquinone biosynthesis C-methylase UbiE